MSLAHPLDIDARAVGVDYFDPDAYLLGGLRRATANGQDVSFELSGHGKLLVSSSRAIYVAQTDDLPALLTADGRALKPTVMASSQVLDLIGGKRGRHIDELMWQAAHHVSEGRLMKGLYRDDVVSLTQWPNLSRLPHTPNALRIATLLFRHPTVLILAARMLKVSEAELFQFYSAAAAAGIAKPVNRAPQEIALPPHRNHGLLSALFRKVTGM